MPRLDPLRRRISVTEEQLELLRAFSNGDIDDRSPVVAPLRDAGLITAEATLHRLVGDLAEAMSRPLLEIWVETMCQSGPTVSHVVVRGDESLWYTDPWPGATDGDEVVFVKDELPQLLWILARLVGFRRSTPPETARPVSADLATVASLLAAFSAEAQPSAGDTPDGAARGSWDDVRTVAIARLDELFGAMSPDQREMWIAVLATLEGTWRITCAWGPETRHSRGLAVWDCGSGGFWVRTTPVEPLLPEQITPDVEATFAPISGGDLWKAFADLLPSKAELTEAAELIGRSAGGADR